MLPKYLNAFISYSPLPYVCLLFILSNRFLMHKGIFLLSAEALETLDNTVL